MDLLGGLSAQAFMRRYWQKKPLLVRQAMPLKQAFIDRTALFKLAASDDVESRLIVREPGVRGSQAWQVHYGPIKRRALPALGQPGWTLLVQGLDMHWPAAHQLLQRFRFIPQARLDDAMISYASPAGGVGPHFDSYDVFLLQVHGSREWAYGPLDDTRLLPELPLKILRAFKPTHREVLHPGDMLYLPPLWGHDGVAVNECMTCSIGFRSPNKTELGRDVLARILEANDETNRAGGPPAPGQLYSDPRQAATDHPGLIPARLQAFAREAVRELLRPAASLDLALGEVLSEPKPQVWFEARPVTARMPDLRDIEVLYLDPRSRMMYDKACVYLNGEAWSAAGRDRRLMCLLADRLHLSAQDLMSASASAKTLLAQWWSNGWVHVRSQK